MHAYVTRQSLKLLREANNLSILWGVKLRFRPTTLCNRGHVGLRARQDEVGDLLRIQWSHTKRTTDDLENASRVQSHEGRDLSPALDAVLLPDLSHNLVAPHHAEVDVKVRHRDTIGVQEALEEEPMAN